MLLLRSFLLWSMVFFAMVLCCLGCKTAPKPFCLRSTTVSENVSLPDEGEVLPDRNEVIPSMVEKSDLPAAKGDTLLVDLQSPIEEETSHIQSIEYSLVEEIESIQTLAEEIESPPSFVEEVDSIYTESEQTNLFSYNEIMYSQRSVTSNVFNDHINFYSLDSMMYLSGGLAVGAVMANTNMDGEIHQGFQDHVSGDTKDFLHSCKELGNGAYTLPVFAGAWAAGRVFEDSYAATWSGEWGGRSMRSLLVGAPPMLLFQKITGASRPGETDDNSRWDFFGDSNGVSGHSFMGALPFINAAKMTENPWLKTTYYVGSTLVPLSRVTDDAHYPSQAVLGWWFAYLAAVAVDDTQNTDRRWQFTPMIHGDQQGGMFELWF